MSFEALHEKLSDLTELLTEEAETTDNVADCLAQIKQAASEVGTIAAALTVEDFEEEYEEGEGEEDEVIDAEVIDI